MKQAEARLPTAFAQRSTLNAQRSPGFSLLELVMVMTMLSVLLLVIAATLWGAVRIERADSAAFQRMTIQSRLADQFREDAGFAVSAPLELGELTASPTCLILKMADNRHVTYQWKDDRLKRSETAGDGRFDRGLPTGGEHVSVMFARSGRDGGVVTMRLIESRGRGRSRRDHPVEISAALGCDLR